MIRKGDKLPPAVRRHRAREAVLALLAQTGRPLTLSELGNYCRGPALIATERAELLAELVDSGLLERTEVPGCRSHGGTWIQQDPSADTVAPARRQYVFRPYPIAAWRLAGPAVGPLPPPPLDPRD